MSKKPQFAKLPWYPRDFSSATRLWPLVARGVYRELLDLQWDVGGMEPGTLPEDDQELRLLVRASLAEWRIAWPLVEPKFPKVEGGRRNQRLEEHRQAAVREYLARLSGAHKTNAKRHGNGARSGTLSDPLTVVDSEH